MTTNEYIDLAKTHCPEFKWAVGTVKHIGERVMVSFKWHQPAGKRTTHVYIRAEKVTHTIVIQHENEVLRTI